MMQFDRENLIRRVLSANLATLPPTQSPDPKTTEALSMLFWMVAKSPEPVPQQRERIYRICHAIAKSYDIYPEMRSLMRMQWQATSMRQLNEQDLRGLYHFMRALEQHINQQLNR